MELFCISHEKAGLWPVSIPGRDVRGFKILPQFQKANSISCNLFWIDFWDRHPQRSTKETGLFKMNMKTKSELKNPWNYILPIPNREPQARTLTVNRTSWNKARVVGQQFLEWLFSRVFLLNHYYKVVFIVYKKYLIINGKSSARRTCQSF